METILGKQSLDLGSRALRARLAGYNNVWLDLGTGDGHYTCALAKQHPDHFVIGVDACRENLHRRSRSTLPNSLFIIASAQELPRELEGLVTHFTVNFPWGSLLTSLLEADPRLMSGLASLAAPVASMEIRLNGGALAEAGASLDGGADRVRGSLLQHGWLASPARVMHAGELRAFPTTWAHRLAFGRDPRAMLIAARRTHPV